MTLACCWCRCVLDRNGNRVGNALMGAEYADASHGACTDCAEGFERGFSNETIIARAAARVEPVAPAQTSARSQ